MNVASMGILKIFGGANGVRRNAAYTVSFGIANKIVTALGQVLLAWYLVPNDIGLVAISASIASFGQIFLATGIKDILVQRQERIPEGGNASVSLGLIVNVLAAMVLIGLSPVIAKIYADARILELLVYTALSWPLSALSSPLAAKLSSDMNFFKAGLLQLGEGVCFTVSAVLLAKNGYGAASLVLPLIWKTAPTIFASFGCLRWHMFAVPSVNDWRNLFLPAVALSLSGFAQAIQMNVVSYVGGYLGATAIVGLYSWGYQMASQAIFLIAINLRQVLFPSFRLEMGVSPRNAKNRARIIALKMSFGVLLVCVFQYVFAPVVIRFVFKPIWWNAIPVVQWLSLALVAVSFEVVGTAVMMGRGKFHEMTLLRCCGIVLLASVTYYCLSMNGSSAELLAKGLVVPSVIISFSFFVWGVLLWPTNASKSGIEGVK